MMKIENMEIITASYLFSPEKYNPGNLKCFYCGIDCDEQYKKSDFVKKTFTNRDVVKFPGSDYVCGCCVESMRTGGPDIILIDGDTKTGRSATPRMYSWVLTKEKTVGFSKRHLDFARGIILNPPDPPFCVILADSGQKQIIFRSPVNYDKNQFMILLEEKEIEVVPKLLSDYIGKATIVSAACGKKSLLNPDEFNNWKNIIDLYQSELPLVEWLKIYSSPMGELAAWLCPGKEEALNGNFVSGRIPEKISKNNGPKEETTGDGREGCQGRGDQILLDFA